MRCGWDCQADGYDDDSRPLPKFRAKWQAYVTALQAGHAPPWPTK